MKKETLNRIKALHPESMEKKIQSSVQGQNLDITLYGPIEGDYHGFWGDIESETSSKTIKKILDENSTVSEINLYLNSPGGDAWEGQAIHSLLSRHPAKIHVYIDGIAASAASVVAMAGDTITMGACAELMIHNAWTYTAGNAKELRKVAEDLDKTSEAMRNAYLIKSDGKLSEEELIRLLDEETFLTAKEALAYGFCDEIENSMDNKELEQAKVEISSLKAEIQTLKEQLNNQVKEPESKPSNEEKVGWFFV